MCKAHRRLHIQVSNKARDITRVLITYREVIGDHQCHRLADLICAFPVQRAAGFEGLGPVPVQNVVVLQMA